MKEAMMDHMNQLKAQAYQDAQYPSAIRTDPGRMTTFVDALRTTRGAFDELEKRLHYLVERLIGGPIEGVPGTSQSAPPREGILGHLTEGAEDWERRIHRLNDAVRRLEAHLPEG